MKSSRKFEDADGLYDHGIENVLKKYTIFPACVVYSAMEQFQVAEKRTASSLLALIKRNKALYDEST